MKEFLQPQEVLLVCDAATGQQAVNVAEKFHSALGLTGIILTKLDGDAAAVPRSRCARSPSSRSSSPVVGEKIEQFEQFYPDRLAGRILGMGDVVSLVEKAARSSTRTMRAGWRRNFARRHSTLRTSSSSSGCSNEWAPCKMSLACCREWLI